MTRFVLLTRAPGFLFARSRFLALFAIVMLAVVSLVTPEVRAESTAATQITPEARKASTGLCDESAAQALRKRAAVAGFALIGSRGAEMGGLHGAGRALPEYLYQNLLAADAVEPLSMTQRLLYPDTHNTPTVSEADNRLHKSLALAKDLDVQFVIGGVIRDMRPVDPDAWGTSVMDGWKRRLGFADQTRRFVFDLVVHDGFSGSPIFERRYETQARWDADRNADVGFMTAAFLQTAYGQAVKTLLDQAAADITAELRCQPFMTRITRVDGKQVYLATGARSGLRTGQEMTIYRRFEFLDSPASRYELQSTGTELRIDQVHPEFSRGTMPVQAGRRNIQQGDIAVIW